MNPIVLTGFAGAALAPDPTLLDERVGSDVVDARPRGGDLRPLKLPVTVASVPAGTQRKTIYRMGRDTPSDTLYWLSWTTEVNLARAYDGVDTTEQTYFTGSGTPKWTNNVIGLSGGPPYPQASRELAVPAPISAPTAIMTTDGSSGTPAVESYVYTFVNDLGWESAPSPPSAGLAMHTGAVVALSTIDTPPAGNYGIDRVRVYKTQVGTSGAAHFFFLREIAAGATTTTDDARSLNYELATLGWLAPPATAHHLLALWNGMFAMLDKHNLHFSVANQPPYAVPVAYDRVIDDTPVALARWEQNLLVLTTGKPKLFNGQDPAGMSESGAAIAYSCASSRSVVSFEHGVVWASAEGLAYAGNLGNKLMTLGVVTPEQWKTFLPDTMVAARFQSWYVCSFASGTRGFMFDPAAPQMGIWFLSYGWDACFYDELQDALYILQGTNIQRFDDGLDAPCSFRSKTFHQPEPRNFPRAKVTSREYPLTFQLYADSVLKFTKTVVNVRPFTLPGGYSADDFEIAVSGVTGSLEEVRVGDLADMKNRA